MTAPPRRWFRFSLRTLFVVVTLVGLWLGYYLNWMQQRREARAWLDCQFIGGSFGPIQSDPSAFPWGLRLLSEERRSFILMRHEPTEHDWKKRPPEEYLRLMEKVRRLFPEAEVWDVTMDYSEKFSDPTH
jgi:protein-S-isoprenylcysteine O-methyltransferase Ste14